MKASLKKWLDDAELPADFYQLVGKPRLCHSRDDLLSAIDEAFSFYLDYQNHKTSKRASQLQKILGKAHAVVSDESRWRKYDRKLIGKLKKEFHDNINGDMRSMQASDASRWLFKVKQVDPGRADELSREWISDSSQSITVPEGLESPQDETDRDNDFIEILEPDSVEIDSESPEIDDQHSSEEELEEVESTFKPPPRRKRSSDREPAPDFRRPPRKKRSNPFGDQVSGEHTEKRRPVSRVWVVFIVFVLVFGAAALLSAYLAGVFDPPHPR